MSLVKKKALRFSAPPDDMTTTILARL
jgi:hypothetical protein